MKNIKNLQIVAFLLLALSTSKASAQVQSLSDLGALAVFDIVSSQGSVFSTVMPHAQCLPGKTISVTEKDAPSAAAFPYVRVWNDTVFHPISPEGLKNQHWDSDYFQTADGQIWIASPTSRYGFDRVVPTFLTARIFGELMNTDDAKSHLLAFYSPQGDLSDLMPTLPYADTTNFFAAKHYNQSTPPLFWEQTVAAWRFLDLPLSLHYLGVTDHDRRVVHNVFSMGLQAYKPEFMDEILQENLSLESILDACQQLPWPCQRDALKDALLGLAHSPVPMNIINETQQAFQTYDLQTFFGTSLEQVRLYIARAQDILIKQ